MDNIELKDRKIFEVEFINQDFCERMPYFPAADVFVNEPDYITKYRLFSKFRDYKFVAKEHFPPGFPINNMQYNNDGLCELISIRACHRILYEDISTGNKHFMENEFLKNKLLSYDELHGNFFGRLKELGEYHKNIFKIKTSINGIKYNANVDYYEAVWGLDNKPGILLYAHDDETGENNYTIYLDGESCQYIHMNFTK